jgi:hypothetical protein
VLLLLLCSVFFVSTRLYPTVFFVSTRLYPTVFFVSTRLYPTVFFVSTRLYPTVFFVSTVEEDSTVSTCLDLHLRVSISIGRRRLYRLYRPSAVSTVPPPASSRGPLSAPTHPALCPRLSLALCPTWISQRTTPKDQTSAASPYASPLSTSGAVHLGLPRMGARHVHTPCSMVCMHRMQHADTTRTHAFEGRPSISYTLYPMRACAWGTLCTPCTCTYRAHAHHARAPCTRAHVLCTHAYIPPPCTRIRSAPRQPRADTDTDAGAAASSERMADKGHTQTQSMTDTGQHGRHRAAWRTRDRHRAGCGHMADKGPEDEAHLNPGALHAWRPSPQACRSAAVCCGLLRSAAVCCGLLRSAAVCCALLRSAAVCCGLLRSAAVCCGLLRSAALCCALLRSAAVCCGLLRSAAVCCGLLRSAAVCCGLLRCPPSWGTLTLERVCSVAHTRSRRTPAAEGHGVFHPVPRQPEVRDLDPAARSCSQTELRIQDTG